MLPAVVHQQLGAGIGLIAKDPPAGAAAELLQKLLGEPIRVGGKGLWGDDPGYLPVADGGVLPLGGLRQTGHRPGGSLHRRAAAHPFDVENTQLAQIGDIQLPRPGAGGQGVASGVAVIGGIGHLPNPYTVQNDEKHTAFVFHNPFPFL